MAISQARSKRKVSGGLYKSHRKKRSYELGNLPTLTKLKETKAKKVRILGGKYKYRLLNTDMINVYDKKTKKYSKVKIKTVVETPANRHFVRRGIITKGTIVDTELGKAKVTNRPGQEKILNGILRISIGLKISQAKNIIKSFTITIQSMRKDSVFLQIF